MVTPAGTSLRTTALAPMRAFSPTVTGPSTWAPEPTMTPFSSVGWRFFRASETPPSVTP